MLYPNLKTYGIVKVKQGIKNQKKFKNKEKKVLNCYVISGPCYKHDVLVHNIPRKTQKQRLIKKETLLITWNNNIVSYVSSVIHA